MKQRIDSFTPVKKTRTPPRGQYGRRFLNDIQGPSPRRHGATPQRPVRDPAAVPQPAVTPTPAPASPKVLPKYPQKRAHAAEKQVREPGRLERSWQRIRLPLLIAGMLTAGLLLRSLLIGEMLVAVYGLLAFVRRISSRTTFLLALVALVGIAVLVVLGGDTIESENFAVYAFLLLAVGTVSLGLEIRRNPV